jgi:hypothetical protein
MTSGHRRLYRNLFPQSSVSNLIFSIVRRDQASSVCTGTGWTVGVRFPVVQNFSLVHSVQMALGPTQPPIQWVPGVLSLVLKRLGREAEHNNGGAIPPLPMSSWHSA